MSHIVFPVNSFADKKYTPSVKDDKYEDDGNFGTRMVDAVEVLKVEPNLYMSKELWVPTGARGGFGGQVRFFLQCIFFSKEIKF
jgi:hypothetical protein